MQLPEEWPSVTDMQSWADVLLFLSSSRHNPQHMHLYCAVVRLTLRRFMVKALSSGVCIAICDYCVDLFSIAGSQLWKSCYAVMLFAFVFSH